MVDPIVIDMEEESSQKVSKRNAKRARKGSLDLEANSEEAAAKSLLQSALQIQENLRVYVQRADNGLNIKVQNYINRKILTLIDIIETLDDKSKKAHTNEDVSELIQKAVHESLKTPSIHEMIARLVIEKTVPKIIEGLTAARVEPQPQILAKAGHSSEAQADIREASPAGPSAATEPYKVVVSKRSRRRTKAANKAASNLNNLIEPTSHVSPEDSAQLQSKPRTMADIVKSLPLKPAEISNSKPTYVTISGPGKSPVEIISGLPSPTEIGVNASIVRATKGGSVLVRMEDSSQAAKVIGWQGLREVGLEAKLALKKRPRLEIKGVPNSWTAEALITLLRVKLIDKSIPASLVNDGLRPVFSSTARNGITKNWVLEVHPTLRFHLLDMACLNEGWWSMTFEDNLDAPRCTKCQDYGHSKATCPSDALVCIWCAGTGHFLKECPKKLAQAGPTCINCVRAKAHPRHTKHKAGSRDCPVHLNWSQKMAMRTSYE